MLIGIYEVPPMRGPIQRMRAGRNLGGPPLTAFIPISMSGSNDFSGFAGEY